MAKRRFKSQRCPNCGAEFSIKPEQSNFCPSCGQENHDLNVPLKHLIEEAVETFFHFDSKSIRTMQALVFRPGLLTSEFVLGKRARYVSPVRLYIFISFLFFLLLSFSSSRTEGGNEAGNGLSPSGGLNITFRGIDSKELRGLRAPQLDSLLQSRNIAPSPVNRYVLNQLMKISTGGQREFTRMIVKNISYMMFLLMPFFGYLVYLFHRRVEPRYIGTLVFSLHYHSLAFVILAALWLLSRIPSLSLVTLLVPVVLAIYLFFAFRSVYGQTRISAFWKTIVVGGLHLLSVIVLFLVTVFASLLLF